MGERIKELNEEEKNELDIIKSASKKFNTIFAEQLEKEYETIKFYSK